MYERLSVATYATHDHSPIRALWNEAFANAASNTGAQARATLEKIALFAGLGGNSQGAAVSSPPFQSGADLEPPLLGQLDFEDRKSTRLNSSHRCISYAVFCLKK